MMLNETYTLSNGVKIPKLGLGTWFIDDDKAGDAVKEAVKLGYRLIDTAQAYGNERGVGEGVRNCGLPRNEIFVTSKVAAEAKSYESAAASIDETLSKMGLDYIDTVSYTHLDVYKRQDENYAILSHNVYSCINNKIPDRGRKR